jgi:hypothetical protein
MNSIMDAMLTSTNDDAGAACLAKVPSFTRIIFAKEGKFPGKNIDFSVQRLVEPRISSIFQKYQKT